MGRSYPFAFPLGVGEENVARSSLFTNKLKWQYFFPKNCYFDYSYNLVWENMQNIYETWHF